MIWWILALAVLTTLAYLADAGVWTLLQDIRIPILACFLLSALSLVPAGQVVADLSWTSSRRWRTRRRPAGSSPWSTLEP